MKKYQKGFIGIILLIILGLAIIGGGSYFYVHKMPAKEINGHDDLTAPEGALSGSSSQNQATSTRKIECKDEMCGPQPIDPTIPTY
jgi:hypothetical protein